MNMPLCPACNEPMKEHGRAFRCEPCRQIIAFYKVPTRSPYISMTSGRQRLDKES
jgi:tRNA(Ile2) C34 agmatinyltransferase TiaS